MVMSASCSHNSKETRRMQTVKIDTVFSVEGQTPLQFPGLSGFYLKFPEFLLNGGWYKQYFVCLPEEFPKPFPDCRAVCFS